MSWKASQISSSGIKNAQWHISLCSNKYSKFKKLWELQNFRSYLESSQYPGSLANLPSCMNTMIRHHFASTYNSLKHRLSVSKIFFAGRRVLHPDSNPLGFQARVAPWPFQEFTAQAQGDMLQKQGSRSQGHLFSRRQQLATLGFFVRLKMDFINLM